jgi:hypothetical protein
MAASTNSSWAPRGPRSRSRPSRRMRFRCANRISIFFRSRRDCSKASVSASERATSRACSWMSCGILRAGSLQHCGLSGHTSQSSLLARYRSVLPCAGIRPQGRHRFALRTRPPHRQILCGAGRHPHAAWSGRMGAQFQHRPRRARYISDPARRILRNEWRGIGGLRRAGHRLHRNEVAERLLTRRHIGCGAT